MPWWDPRNTSRLAPLLAVLSPTERAAVVASEGAGRRGCEDWKRRETWIVRMESGVFGSVPIGQPVVHRGGAHWLGQPFLLSAQVSTECQRRDKPRGAGTSGSRSQGPLVSREQASALGLPLPSSSSASSRPQPTKAPWGFRSHCEPVWESQDRLLNLRPCQNNWGGGRGRRVSFILFHFPGSVLEQPKSSFPRGPLQGSQ